MMAFYSLARPLLFALPPETAHGIVLSCAAGASRLPGCTVLQGRYFGFDHPSLRTRLWGRDFPNPVGLAAGLDKDGIALETWLGLGFGFVEAGTVTPLPQEGNPRPRLFRLPADEALINRMGFNNKGAAALAARIQALKIRLPEAVIGVNLGKNRNTSLEEAAEDYLSALGSVYAGADYLVVNVSSPNTPGLRGLQNRDQLARLLDKLSRRRTLLEKEGAARVPILVKIAPDLDEKSLGEVVRTALETPCDGLIATNTTLAREGLRSRKMGEEGGLSGAPLRSRALATVSTLHRIGGGRLPIMGVGGISGPDDAYAFIRAGASLIQVFTGLIYQGPGLVKSIKTGLVKLLARDGFDSVQQAVGSGHWANSPQEYGERS